tara:strand:+ start:1904 stop:2551 length:648 start_codon:yes stop_codon:yes gene_type:complete
VRQHVNPLSEFFQLPLRLPDKTILFKQPHYPIHIDIGSAKGEFLIELASKHSKWNFLGLDIREPLVVAAERKRKKLALQNLKFLFCNANVSLDKWLLTLDYGQLKRVSIQFPDPWFKRKHFKRRVLKSSFLNTIAKSLSKDGEFFIQSDVLKLIESMVEVVDRSNYFNRKTLNGKEWLDENPYQVYTDREIYVLTRDMPVYRAMFLRNNKLVNNS